MTSEPAPSLEPTTRWRLVLGRYASSSLGCQGLPGSVARMDIALDYLYGRELERRGLKSDRQGSLDPSQVRAVNWLAEIRDLFPASVCQTITAHALARYGITDILKDPAALERLEPNEALLQSLMALKDRADGAVQSKIREVARRVVEEIIKRLKADVSRAFSGKRNRFERSQLKVLQNFDWRATIRENLKNWDRERGVIVAERLRFNARVRRRFPWTVILCVDQSGSMAASVIHSAVMAAILAGLPSVKLHLVVFDTSVVDLTDRVSDPVGVLMSVQLGGGTDIGRAVSYCEGLITQPSRTVFVLVSDFCEGASPARLLAAVKRLAEARVTMLGLAALDGAAVPDYDRTMGEQLAASGMSVSALTPEHFAEWLAGVIR
jgi:Mg-chelatase subunit ChlD